MDGDESNVLKADEVVVAGGVGAAAKALGGLPMMNHPGTLAYARSLSSSSHRSNNSKDQQNVHELNRILVDTVTQSH
eukprot:4869923-Ditylum_brightwellii.AAC.1